MAGAADLAVRFGEQHRSLSRRAVWSITPPSRA